MRVHIGIHGDSALARRFSEFLEFSVEDAGWTSTSSENGASASIDGEVDEDIQTRNIGVGVVRVQLTQDGKPTKMESCATMNSDANGELFDGAAKNTTSDIRGKFPEARTVRFDASSDTKASTVFREQLPIALRNAGFRIVESGGPDILLHIELVRQQVAVEERVAKYDVEAFDKDGRSLGESTGTTVISAKLASPRVSACPASFDDLSWLAGNGLYNDAQRLVASLRKQPPADSKNSDRKTGN